MIMIIEVKKRLRRIIDHQPTIRPTNTIYLSHVVYHSSLPT